jgi:glycosyltransferase involved in cell wall biosynthesis
MQSYGMANSNHLVLQNVVEDLYFASVKAINQPESSSRGRFIHVSCFTDRSKNISGLLRVLARMNRSGIDFECILVGEGEDFEMLKTYAVELDLKSPQVQFRGLLTGEVLVQAMRSASFLVLFSDYENMPVVINEAFAMGIPVIATDTGGISEHVKEWNGRLVEPQDEEALFSTMRSFIKQEHNFDAEKIKNYAELWFGSSAVENQLKELYADKK